MTFRGKWLQFRNIEDWILRNKVCSNCSKIECLSLLIKLSVQAVSTRSDQCYTNFYIGNFLKVRKYIFS